MDESFAVIFHVYSTQCDVEYLKRRTDLSNLCDYSVYCGGLSSGFSTDIAKDICTKDIKNAL